MSQQDSKNPAYNLQLTYHFKGAIDYSIFNRSLGLLFERHSTMFSVFRQDSGDPYIDIVPREVKAESVDFTELPVEFRKEKLLSFAIEDSRKSFDIENGPLFRLYLLKENNSSYYFHATIHHIIFDGWSRRIFVEELSRIYNDLQAGRNIEIEQLSFHSFDYAEQESTLLDSKQENDLIEFWKSNLKDCPAELKLPCDFPRKAFSSGLGSRESFEIAKEFTAGLKEIGYKQDTSLFNIVVSLLGVLFHKYSGESDICIGIPVSNRRNFPSSEKTFGLFINTSVVRLKVDSKKSFIDQVKYSKDIVRDAIKNSKLPFNKIVESVKPERNPGVNPLFQVSLSWLTDLTIPMDFGSIRGERTTLSGGVSPFDITFYMWEEKDVIKGDIEYNIDLFNPSTIIGLKDSLIQLAQSLVDSQNENLSEVSAITRTQMQRLDRINDTALLIPNCLAHNFFEEQAIIQPSKIAVYSGNSSLTYKELDDLANQLARHLLSFGLKSGETVGICLERSAEMLVSVLGVLKSGCCYLPMDPLFPDDRLIYMFEDSGARVLISENSLKDRFLQFANIRTILIDRDKEEIIRNSNLKPELLITNQSPVYIIYTSGSTGKPKGVKVHHESVVNLIESMSVKPGIKANDTLLAVVTLSFDMSVYELFVTLSKGATVVIAGSDDITDGPVIIKLIEKHNVTLIQGTPSFWSILLSAGWHGKKDLKALCGGEALTYSLIRQILPKVGEFWNCYGPTETTVYATCTRVIDENAPIVIGKPINNTSIHILDKDNNLLPAGVTGEVAIGGICVAKGYHNRPDLTMEKFIRIKNNGVVYKTGDLGRFNNDDNVELFGRADNQIKLRGFRVEPGEIETLLSKFKGVRESVVALHRFDADDERLVAFLNTTSEFTLSDEEIKTSLSQHLPGYMVPSFFQNSDGFPRLPNGKINKKELLFDLHGPGWKPVLDFDTLSATQKKLLTIWESVLKTQIINLTDNFFDNGGNSLLGIRLINKIRDEFNIPLTFRELLVNSTLGQMGSLIDNKKSDSRDTIELVHLTEMKNLPLTRNQKRLWLLSKLHPDVPSYVIRSTFKFNGPLNLKLFEQSLHKLFQRHHIVFSMVREKNGEPYCDIVPKEVVITNIDLTNLPGAERSDRVKNVIYEDSKKVFDLENGPLYRLFLIKTAEDEHYFYISIHHIIFDGWSQGIFSSELSQIYNGLLKGKDLELPALEFHQYDFAFWESGRELNTKSAEFWRENLAGCTPVLNFPYDYPRSEQNVRRGGLEMVSIPKALSDDLRRISKEAGTSLFTTLMSVFGLLMKKYSGEDDINIGLPVAYRPHSALEKIFGMFVNTVVVRMRYENVGTFQDLIKKTDDAAMNAISNQDLPFENVVEIVNPERVIGANPLFQVAFVWQNNLYVPVNLDGVNGEVIKGDQRTATFDLSIAMWENADIIEGEIEYNMDIIKPETIKRLKEHFLVLVHNLTANINLPVNSVSMITDEEIKLFSEINITSTDYPRDKTMVELFQEKVAIFPDKTAVTFKGESITYRHLNEKSNQLARLLRESGVARNTPVGLFTDKSLEMVIGMLAILKAGGCYVPLDPDYPTQRINFILKDSGIKAMLLQSKYMGIEIDEVLKFNLNSQDSYNLDNSNLQIIINPEDFSYIIYTSGTTGTPKGTPIYHRCVLRTLCNANWISLNPDDRVLQQAPIVFDMSIAEIWGPLLHGGSLYVIDKETLLNPEAIAREMLENDITVLIITPAIFTKLLESKPEIFKKLKYMAMGGDVLPVAHINMVRELNPDLIVINGYGPTENTCVSAFYKVDRDFDKSIPIGRPNSNSTVYIFDKHLNYQPIGVVGELYVGGDGLSPGYLNREDLNTKCFIENPHNSGERLYKTGDLVKWLPDLYIDFLGRADNQLKIRGFRIELEEIESVISELEGVRETVVKAVKIEQGDYRLVSFLNVPESFTMNKKDIVEKLRTKLPVYMIPSSFKFMHEFPKTINGKTDRKALIYDFEKEEKEIKADINLLLPVERILFKIWSNVLKTDDIQVTDNFFDVGGNSLLAISLANLISKEFDIELNSIIAFKYPTIKGQSDFISGGTKLETSSESNNLDDKISRRRNVNFRKLRDN
jgi:amino acid adenylation domain-containing protein